MVEIIRGKKDTGDETRINAWAVLRYSMIFAAIVVPADFVMLEFPAIVLATWLVARRVARRYRRQITAYEALQLAVASYAWMFIAWLFQTGVNTPPLGFVGFLLAWQVISFVTVWTAYVWLARFVIRRNLGIQSRVEEAGTASQMLAQQEERYAEAKARTITLGVAWLSVGILGLPAVILFGVIVVIVLRLLGLEIDEGGILLCFGGRSPSPPHGMDVFRLSQVRGGLSQPPAGAVAAPVPSRRLNGVSVPVLPRKDVSWHRCTHHSSGLHGA